MYAFFLKVKKQNSEKLKMMGSNKQTFGGQP
jgi:hypothetical protein